MMDDAEYQRDALKKISRYQQTPDANRFIYIFESKDAPMNMKAIENLLRVYFWDRVRILAENDCWEKHFYDLVLNSTKSIVWEKIFLQAVRNSDLYAFWEQFFG